MDDNNIIVFGYDLNRSPGVVVVAGIAILALAVAAVLLMRSRAKGSKWLLPVSAVVLVGGLVAAVALAGPPLVRHYQWHEVSGERKFLSVGTRAAGTFEMEKSWQFGFERQAVDPDEPPAYYYRCEGDTCETLLETRFIVARCHHVLWRTIALWEPPETCIVRAM